MDREATFDAGEVEIAYSEGPVNGPPLIYLHGLGSNRDSNPLVHEPLRARSHFFRLDLRGHGRSGRVSGGYRWTRYPADVAAFIRSEIGEPTIVVGQSLGAVTTLALAGTEPDLVAAVVASEPPFYVHEWDTEGPSRFAKQRDLALLASRAEIEAAAPQAFPDDPPEAVAATVEACVETDPDAFGQVVDGTAFEGYEPDALIAAIRCPLLIPYGDVPLGGVLRPEDVERIRARNPRAELIHFDGVGHMVLRQAAPRFLEATLAFLDRVMAGSS